MYNCESGYHNIANCLQEHIVNDMTVMFWWTGIAICVLSLLVFFIAELRKDGEQMAMSSVGYVIGGFSMYVFPYIFGML
jgi:hypothetical protein